MKWVVKRMWNMRKMDMALIVFYIILTVLMAVAALWFKADSGKYAEKHLQVTVEGKVLQKVALPIQGKSVIPFRTKLGYNQILIDGDQVSIQDADCRDKVCVHSGKIQNAGQLLVCLPHKFIIEIKGVEKKDNEVDSVTH